MITLTTPPEINTVLGGNTPASYNKLVIAPFTMDGVTQIVLATLRLTSTTVPTATPILGTLRINLPGGNEFILEVPQLDIVRRLVLSGGQATAVLAQIETAQAALENGLVSLGVVSGTRSAGV